MVLCIHGEDTGPGVDMFDREAVFVEKTLPSILTRFQSLRVVLEHCTTKQAVEVVQRDTSGRRAARISCHHLLHSRSAPFEGSRQRPHMFCLPVLEAEEHRQALLNAIKNDDAGQFFLGTDSAPHNDKTKSLRHMGALPASSRPPARWNSLMGRGKPEPLGV